MYAHRTIQRLSNLHVQFDLPREFERVPTLMLADWLL